MSVQNTSFDELIYQYIKAHQPRASEAAIQVATTKLHVQLANGTIDRDDVLDRVRPKHSSPEQHASPKFGDIARACRDLDGGRLSPRERAFVHQMVGIGFNAHPSQRQAAWLAALFARLQRSAAA